MTLAFERVTIFCRDLDASLAFYRETIVFDPDGILVSLMQIDPLPEEAVA